VDVWGFAAEDGILGDGGAGEFGFWGDAWADECGGECVYYEYGDVFFAGADGDDLFGDYFAYAQESFGFLGGFCFGERLKNERRYGDGASESGF